MIEPEVNKLINRAKDDEEKVVIRTIMPRGDALDWAYAEIADEWVVFVEGAKHGHVSTETAVRNAIQNCDPDVELVDKSDSLFSHDE